jgi:hypothetical protein
VSINPSQASNKDGKSISDPRAGMSTGTAFAPAATASMYFSPTMWK